MSGLPRERHRATGFNHDPRGNVLVFEFLHRKKKPLDAQPKAAPSLTKTVCSDKRQMCIPSAERRQHALVGFQIALGYKLLMFNLPRVRVKFQEHGG